MMDIDDDKDQDNSITKQWSWSAKGNSAVVSVFVSDNAVLVSDDLVSNKQWNGGRGWK